MKTTLLGFLFLLGIAVTAASAQDGIFRFSAQGGITNQTVGLYNSAGSLTFDAALTEQAGGMIGVTPTWGVVAGVAKVSLAAASVGVSDTFARVDHVHQFDQTIQPTLTKPWTFSSNITNTAAPSYFGAITGTTVIGSTDVQVNGASCLTATYTANGGITVSKTLGGETLTPVADTSDGVTISANGFGIKWGTGLGIDSNGALSPTFDASMTSSASGLGVKYGAASNTAAQGSNTITLQNADGSFTFSAAPTIGTAAAAQSITPEWGVVAGVTSVGNPAAAIGVSTTFSRVDHRHQLSMPLVFTTTSNTNALAGQVWNDSTRKTLLDYTDGITRSLSGVIWTQTTTVGVAASTSEVTPTTAGIGSLIIPAGFHAVGKTLRFKGKFFYASPASPAALTFSLKSNGATLISTSAGAPPANVVSNFGEYELEYTCHTTGGAGTIYPSGRVLFIDNTGATKTLCLHTTSPISFDTTAANALSLTFQWAAADAGNAVTFTNGTVEVLQ